MMYVCDVCVVLVGVNVSVYIKYSPQYPKSIPSKTQLQKSVLNCLNY